MKPNARSIARSIAALILGVAVSISGGHATEKGAPIPPPHMASSQAPQSNLPPLIEKVSQGVYRLGGITVDKNNRAITFPAQVNMDKGMLEYLIVHRKGKTHESLLNTLIEPYNLQIAFLLLGYEGSEEKLAGQGDASIPRGNPITIMIRSEGGAQNREIPADHWLVQRIEQEVRNVPPMEWIYTGSMRVQEYFLAQETGSISAIWHDPAALIDNASPGGESNRIWFVKEGTVPPVGTPVDVTILPVK